MTFFQLEQARVFGLQLNAAGEPSHALSYAYKFNLQEMKEPLKQAVLLAGWSWQPVVWNAPSWVKWLAE